MMWWFAMIDEMQDKRIDNLEQRLVLLEQTLLEVKGMLRAVKTMIIVVAAVLGLNVHQIML